MQDIEETVMPLLSLVLLIAFYMADMVAPFEGFLHLTVGLVAWLHVLATMMMLFVLGWKASGSVASATLSAVIYTIVPGLVLLFGDHFLQGGIIIILASLGLILRWRANS